MKQPTAYLPLEKFHIIPIHGLSPDEIKKSVSQVSRDREKIKHSTLLNACAKALGFKGGNAGYKFEYESKLKPFMEEHQLITHTDLVSPRYIGYGLLSFKLSYQDISERLFFSKKSIPKKLFTGYDFHYENHFDDGVMLYGDTFGLEGIGLDLSEKVKLANKHPLEEIPTPSYKFCDKRSLIDMIIGSENSILIYSGFNVIGDQLTYPRQTNIPELCLYNRTPEDIDTENEFFNLFVKRIDEIGQGWVDIIPYNENLIFLRGEKGEYSFVFRNQRDKEFTHDSEFEPYLKRSEVPRFNDDYHFDRWYYFEHEGFKHKLLHEAEAEFYAKDGTVRTYPGLDTVLKNYIYDEYKKTLKPLASKKALKGFQRFEFSDDKVLMVSDLISIEDFKEFMYANSEYLGRRIGLDNLNTVNDEDDESLPVALTGYDMLKYIDWFNTKHDIETRLLSLEEYKAITPFVPLYEHYELIREFYSSDAASYCVFTDKDGNATRKPAYMEEDEFQSLTMQFYNPKFKFKNQLRFMDSHFFAEWLKDFSCIRSNSLTSIYSDNIFRSKPPLSSTGKWKYIKIGFRLCYELEA